MADRTEPQEIDRRLALIEAPGGIKIEVFVLKRRWAFGRWDVLCAPARGRGQRWVREENVEYLEPGEGGDDG